VFRRLLPLLLLLTLLAGCTAPTSANPDLDVEAILQAYPQLRSQPWAKATVKRVVDGDTFETKQGDKVRLIGVNTPETVKPNSPVEVYGKEASDYTKKMLTGKAVYMFRDAGDKDNYGRLLRYVFIAGDTVMYNETLVAEGYANTMTIQPNVMFQKKFLELERGARAGNKGLWGASGTPNSSGPSAKCAQPKIKGNINAKKEKLYHVPGGRYYEETKAEAMFCSEDEAQAAGYRKSME
jgi:micrococcal nuclease